MTLLEGLNGAAADTVDSEPVITAESLKGFLYQNFKFHMVPQDREKGNLYEPQIEYDGKPPKLVIGPVPPTSITPKVRLIAQSAGAAGAEFTIVRKSKKVAGGTLDANPIEIELEVGLYVLQVPAANYADALEVKASKVPQDVVV